MSGRLKGKVAIVTGAASGIGRATVTRFAQEGARVVVADINADGAAVTADEIRSAGGDAIAVRVDITSAGDVEDMAMQAAAAFGRVDVLFSNAAIHLVEDQNPVTHLDEAIWDRVVQVDLKGVFLTCKYVFPQLVSSGGGSVIITSSTSALRATDPLAYTAAKGGIISMVRTLAAQFASANIRVNAIAPGAVDTPMLDSAALGTERKHPLLEIPSSLLGRRARPEEIANLVLFLASDEASFITAATYPVDGGAVAR